ncbi:hypothetical protein SNE40_003485 [Patella caerulea]|uniref:Uncharacterized protein n=1 Tax=Patella caerulea TaxID=87958 RepID=A0AAN8KE25_PATCE
MSHNRRVTPMGIRETRITVRVPPMMEGVPPIILRVPPMVVCVLRPMIVRVPPMVVYTHDCPCATNGCAYTNNSPTRKQFQIPFKVEFSGTNCQSLEYPIPIIYK